MDALTALAATVRLLAAEQADPAAAQLAMRLAETAASAAPAELAQAVKALRDELSWRKPKRFETRGHGRADTRKPDHAAVPVVLPGTRLSLRAAPATRAALETAPDGLYWLPEGTLAARVGGATLIGNLCVIGRGRHTECCAPQCARDLVGCPGFHDPLRYPASPDARALPLPRNLRRAAIPWLPSREHAEAALAGATPESVAVLEAAAMHSLILAIAAKNELALAGPE